MSATQKILAALQPLSELDDCSGGIWVGYSGGLDSTVLLHGLSRLALSVPLRAIHIHHGLSTHADSWAEHCESVARSLNVPCETERVALQNRQKGTENAAREARYKAFKKYLGPHSVLALAHHQNDQLETFLFRLNRGAGVRGLTAMSSENSLADAKVWRPLLALSKSDLLDYANENTLSWVEDDSNSNNEFDRNFLRNRVFPLLKNRWPRFESKWLQSLDWLSEADSLLHEYAQQDFLALARRDERLGQSIRSDHFFTYSQARQKHLVRMWVESAGYSLPDAAHLQLLPQFQSDHEKTPCVAWGDCELRRFQNRLYLLPRQQAVAPTVVKASETQIVFSDGSFLSASNSINLLNFTVRFREARDRCKPLERGHSQTLKKLMQEYSLEPWLRNRAPLLLLNDQIVALADLFVCDSKVAKQLASANLTWGFEPLSRQ